MAHLIDTEDLMKCLEKYRPQYVSDSKKPGLTGASARCALAIEGPLTLWRTTESNAKSDPRDVIQSLMMMFVNAIAGEIGQVIDDPNLQIEVAGGIGIDMRARLLEAIKLMQSGQVSINIFESKQAGRA